MTAAAKTIERISVEDYLATELMSDVKREYTGGYVYAMAGARTVHNKVSVAFVSAVHGRLRGHPCQPFNSDMKVRIRCPTHTRFYYPDGMIVCEPNTDGESFQDRPVVIAEVMSADTRRTDENEKRDAYLTIPTLVDYLLIETDVPRVNVYHRTASGFVTNSYDSIQARVPLASVGFDLPLAELYERVEFAPAAPRLA
jgi:Uma2 family endonuclease